ncbi:MAG: outer membrane beta-barrel protein [Mariniblastus sp.]
MRKTSIFAFALVVVNCVPLISQSNAQAVQNYPWRNNSQAAAPIVTANDSIRVARATEDVSRIPAPPVTKRPYKVAFRNQETATQPSISDVRGYTFDAPAPAVQPAAKLPDVSSPEPSLSVMSNASTAPEVNYCARDCKKSCCNLGCEKKLFGQHCSGLEIGGWLSTGYHNRATPLVNNRPGEANLHQMWLYFDKAASRDSCDWDIGYRADLLYGIDAQDLQAFGNAPTGAATGWDNGWDNGAYGWALPQLYVQFANADWDVKAGKFFSPFGYEVIGARDNFFYSHNYSMYNSEPFTMSGVLGERRVSENRSIILGVTAGWDTGFENNSGGNLITGFRYQPNEFVDLALTTSLGDTGARGSGRMTSGVAQFQLTDNVKYVLQGDVLNLGTNQEFGIIQYLFRDINECLALGARLEWWKSDQFFTDTKSTYDFTVGANYRANANVTIRPELRFDWGAAAVDPGTPIFGIDAVMTF